MLKRKSIAGALIVSAAFSPLAFSETFPSVSVYGATAYTFSPAPAMITPSGANPTWGAALLPKSSTFLGLGSVNANASVGTVDNPEQVAEGLSDIIGSTYGTVSEAEAAAAGANPILQDLAENGYVSTAIHVTPPLLPFTTDVPGLGGKISISYVHSDRRRYDFLDDEARVETAGSDYIVVSNSAIYGRSAEGATTSLSYSRELFSNWRGSIHAGVSLHHHDYDLSNGAASIQTTSAETVIANAKTAAKSYTVNETAITADIGLAWVSPLQFVIGVTAKNIGEPTFKYSRLPTDCTGTDPSTNQGANCRATAFFGQRLEDNRDVKLNTQITIDGSYQIPTTNLILMAGADTNASRNITGEAQRWSYGTIGYLAESPWIPSPTIGIKDNNSGDEGTYVTGSLSWPYVHFDLSVGRESVDVDGDSTPRAISASLSFNAHF